MQKYKIGKDVRKWATKYYIYSSPVDDKKWYVRREYKWNIICMYTLF